MMNRRNFIEKTVLGGIAVSSAGLIASCVPQPKTYPDKYFHIKKGYHALPKLRLSMDRIVKETVGLRPYRASGPRLDVEQLGSKTIVHNYGHGGSGWSLSWGTGNIARRNVLATKERKIAVLGCGTVGIATSRLLQESGCDVTIYAKDLPPNVTSNLATGTWSPGYSLCDPAIAKPEFKAAWEEATRFSFRRFQMMLGMNDIVSWMDDYGVFLNEPKPQAGGGGEAFHLEDLVPGRVRLSKKEHPFKADYVTRGAGMTFNIPSYLHHQLSDFHQFGGKVKIMEIKSLEDIDALEEKVVVNCMGLGAKPVFNDQELTPISGQLSCLIPQSDINYKLSTSGAYFINRKDGIYLGGNSLMGNWDTTPSKEQTEKVFAVLNQLMKDMKG